jgi:ATP-dependent DNA ligase
MASTASPLRSPARPGLEGIVSKRLTAPYRSGPSQDWRKNPDNQAMRRARDFARVGH